MTSDGVAAHTFDPDWLALHREDILEPDLPIIDPHHHLWAREDRNRYLIDDFRRDAERGHDIRASVFVECGSFYRKGGPELMRPLGEVEFANGVGAMAASGTYGKTLICAGIVGGADLRAGAEIGRLLDAQMAAAPERFKGIRFSTKWDADEELNTGRYKMSRGYMEDRKFREGLAQLTPRRLSFDAMIYHPQIPELASLSRAFPDLPIVLNHIGGLIAHTRSYIARKDEAIAQWRSNMTELATCPNVHVKLGGLGMSYLCLGLDTLEEPAPSERVAEAWRPFYEHCIEKFGASRCMFESNYPPDGASADYPIIWNAFKRIAANYSPDEKRALFYGTAAKVYRIA